MTELLQGRRRSNWLRLALVFILTVFLTAGCGGSDDDDPAPSGIDNSDFRGTYTVTMEIVDCEGPNTFAVEVGNDKSRKDDDDGYLYIPLSSNQESWSFEGVNKTVSVSGNTVKYSETESDGSFFKFTAVFSADYRSFDLTGEENDPDGCSGAITGEGVIKTTSQFDLTGTWDIYSSSGVKENFSMIVIQEDNTLYVKYDCGYEEMTFTLDGNKIESEDSGVSLITGTINDDGTELNCKTYDGGVFHGEISLKKVSDTYAFVSKGTFTINGSLCGNTVSLNSDMVCGRKEYEDDNPSVMNGIEIGAQASNGSIGFEFELDTSALLSSGTTYNLQDGDFELKLKGSLIEDCYGNSNDELIVTQGSVEVETYDGTTFKGTFDITVDGKNFTGSFDIDF